MFNRYQTFKIALAFTNLLLFSTLSYADITIGVFSSTQTHNIGDELPVISLFASNPDGEIDKDVHIGMISPNNVIYEYPNWNTNLQPWLPSFTIPANFQLGNTNIFTPAGIPGGLTQGIWQIYFALTEPGTLNITHLQIIDLNIVDLTSIPNAGVGSRYGSVSLVRVDASVLNQVSISGTGTFLQADTGITDLIGSLEEEVGEEPVIDQCVFNQHDNNPSSPNPPNLMLTPLDAGNITITANETINMDKTVAPDSIFYRVNPDNVFFDSSANFTFSSSGSNQLGSFNVTVPSTNVFTLIEPSGVNFEADPGQDFNLVWANNNFGSGEVIVTLVGIYTNLANPQDSVSNSIFCRFVDDGQAAIPGPLIAQLQQSLPSDSGIQLPDNLPVDLPFELPNLNNNLTLTIVRSNSKFFTSGDPQLDIGVATVSSGTSKQGSF